MAIERVPTCRLMAIERVPTCRLMVIERFSLMWVMVIERFSPLAHNQRDCNVRCNYAWCRRDPIAWGLRKGTNLGITRRARQAPEHLLTPRLSGAV
mmetsp:Transcript_3820/g.12160  ORF Transcript_3820/g.12160 Transcript_3820/m.12160 type:complete len:96 (-) Transcript_3820:71-358(-)